MTFKSALSWLSRDLSTCPKSDVANIHLVCKLNCFSTSRHYYVLFLFFYFHSYFYFTTSRSYSSGVTTQLSQFTLSYIGALLLSKKIPPLDYLYFSIHRLPERTIRPPSSHPRVAIATAAFVRSIRRMDFNGSRLWELSAVGQVGIAAL